MLKNERKPALEEPETYVELELEPETYVELELELVAATTLQQALKRDH